MAEQAAFKIGGIEYPIVTDFTLGDPVLISQITGMDYPVFLEKLKEDEQMASMDPEHQRDPVLMLGLIAASVWRVQKKWSRDKVKSFVERVSMDALQVEGGEDDTEVEDGLPPAMDGES